ncbi:DNA-formamidopyrimidine glycosylase [Liquorilactobacillus mali]|uniref:Formamidopyrimidine-DNA glycosylase n=1 Tax=Liquorilactobacillus mali KCTC 3596 = DSM 20444 TaxID=1046596 RepID=J0L4E1_9LACO|nr:DNA-formamidopyrimidine glycosylase [Liquorilactobacillus mali]EJE98263.1 formamidopyrimidine-DNA glycosylase [Liquorilactobacillus mali KCTC 3596 = DSM 20444]KRN10497.1 formamidopyrimidine-DNA glycosylase [Liquorilactobacillus mali KCTC 3596 = DSM 20444]MDC7951863.1 DNA-formamidopyrimidine glycosylase [Liquorilactobacillus mali]
MPELPEVETVRQGLRQLVLNKKIRNVIVLYPKIINGDTNIFIETLEGLTIKEIKRRGKYLIFNFNEDISMVSHLRMEGKYFVRQAGDEVEKHTHIIFEFTDGKQLRYNDVRKFGRMELVKTDKVADLKCLKKLGPEPTKSDFSVEDFADKLKKKNKMIKPALLDQNLVAGLGNIYVDEVLWMSKINPETIASHLSKNEIEALHDAIITELAKAVKAGGTTIRSYTNAFENSGLFQFELNAYGRTGEPCRRCGTLIKKIVVAQRGTHYCPSCQKVE